MRMLKPWILFICLIGIPAQLPASDRPNVLFIAVDDLKPVLGCYGDTIAITPNLDRLAAEGTVFLNAHCQWPVCGASRASLMTSLRPEAVGVMDLKTDMRAKNADVLTIPQHFKNNGYVTTGVGKIYDPRCVDDKKSNDAPSWSIPFSNLPHNKIQFDDVEEVLLAPDVADEELIDGRIARIGIELMQSLSKSDKPFFLAVGFKKPHLPFVAPKKYWDIYHRKTFSLANHPGGINHDSGYSLHDSPEFRGYGGVPKSGSIPEALQRESIHGYYACTSFVDAQIGLLLTELKDLGLEENTVIILWGDHGFHLGDHGMWGKHSTLEQATRSPLIIRPVGGAKVHQTTTPVELSDIFPTLCNLTGLATPQGISGRSLTSIIEGTTSEIREGALTVFKYRGSIGYSYRTERYRYTEWVNKDNKTVATELFDYDTDPHETNNLASSPRYATLQAELAKQLRTDGQGCERLIGSPLK